MKIKPSALVTDLRGSAGGSTIQQSRYGLILRNKPVPAHRDTAPQQIRRGQFQVIAHQWGRLSQAFRDQWNSQALNWPFTDIFGDTYFITGFNLYLKLNLVRTAIGQSLIAVAPLPATVFQFTVFNAVWNPAIQGWELGFDPTPTAATSSVQVFASRPVGQGKVFSGSTFKQITVFTGSVAQPQIIASEYSDVFGFIPQIGTRVFFQLLPSLTAAGQQGVPIEDFSDIT